MPMFVTCVAACLALVIAVGLQAPAVSVGVRWTPAPPSPLFKPIMYESDRAFDFALRLRVGDGWPVWVYWVLAALAAMAAVMGLRMWMRYRRGQSPARTSARTGAAAAVSTEAEARILQSGLLAAIDILDVERDAGNAIVQAWQGLQDAAASAGVHRRPAETASEFTARILYRSRGSATPIAVLLSLYQRVRFGEHRPTSSEIADARHALAQLVALWRADFPERRATPVAHA